MKENTLCVWGINHNGGVWTYSQSLVQIKGKRACHSDVFAKLFEQWTSNGNDNSKVEDKSGAVGTTTKEAGTGNQVVEHL